MVVSLCADCGLSVRWQPDENIESYNDFSPTNVKDKWTDPENIVKPSLVSVL